MRWPFVLLLLVLSTASSGCFLVRAGLGGARGDAGGSDGATADAEPGAPDAARRTDASIDASSTPDAAGTPDAGPPPDAAVPCEETTHLPTACSASHTDVTDCERLYDRLETMPICPERSTLTLSCAGATRTYCDYSGSCSDPAGCIEDVWLQFDLGAAVPVSEARFLAGWWQDRPNNFEIWYSNSSSDVPDAGATRIFMGDSDTAPWRCVTGEACTEEVPDGCCRDGRSSPQVTDQTGYAPSCDLGTFFPKFNAAPFTTTVARYWYLMVRDGAYPDRIFLNEVELRRLCPP